MPRTADESRRALWRGAGAAWDTVAELLTATAVWAAIGFGLDRLFGTEPVLLVVGAVVGHMTGIYMLWVRHRQQVSARGDERGSAQAK